MASKITPRAENYCITTVNVSYFFLQVLNIIFKPVFGWDAPLTKKKMHVLILTFCSLINSVFYHDIISTEQVYCRTSISEVTTTTTTKINWHPYLVVEGTEVKVFTNFFRKKLTNAEIFYGKLCAHSNLTDMCTMWVSWKH